jgi:hypothetical protein
MKNNNFFASLKSLKKGVGSGSNSQRYGSPTLLESRIPVDFHADLCWGSPEHESSSLCFVQPFKVSAGRQLLTQQSENIKGKNFSSFVLLLPVITVLKRRRNLIKLQALPKKMRQKVERSLLKMEYYVW